MKKIIKMLAIILAAAVLSGQLQSYSHFSHDGIGGGTFAYDHYEKLSNNIEIYDILTKDGRRLEIKLYACLINLKEPTKEGIFIFHDKSRRK